MDYAMTAALPRTYRLAWGWKLLVAIIGLAFFALGAAGLMFLTPGLAPRGGDSWVPVLLTLLFTGSAVLGVYGIASALVYRVVLGEHEIEVVGPLRRRKLLLQDIQGRRKLQNRQGPATLILVPKDPSAASLKINLTISTDAAFDDWCARLTDLDQQDLRESEQAVAQSLYQDLDPAARDARIARLRKLALVLNYGTMAGCLGSLFFPDAAHLTSWVLIALPWIGVALVARFQPLYRFGNRKNDAHPDLTLMLLMPGFVLATRALQGLSTVDWHPVLLMSVVGAALLAGAVVACDPWLRQQRGSTLLMALLLLAYGYGAGLTVNALADPTVPRSYTTEVLGKRVSHGKSTTWYLRVAPWGPVSASEEIRVPADRYRMSQIGDKVCVFLGAGALHIPWYQLRDCPGQY